jgi:hypothetical protein
VRTSEIGRLGLMVREEDDCRGLKSAECTLHSVRLGGVQIGGVDRIALSDFGFKSTNCPMNGGPLDQIWVDRR